MDTVILARHGESERSLSDLTNGDPRVRVMLTAEGREQARQLGESLRRETIELCVTSEFPRAQETADLALDGRDVPRLVLADFDDIDFGAFEGKPLTDYRAWAHSHGPAEPAPGDGESRVETVARYVRGYRTLLSRPEASVLLVAHGLPIRYILDAAAGRNPAAAVAHVPLAEAFRLPAATLREAVERLERWVADPAWG